MEILHVCAASVIFIETLELGKVPSLYSPGVCIIVHGVSTVTVTTCEPYVVYTSTCTKLSSCLYNHNGHSCVYVRSL